MAATEILERTLVLREDSAKTASYLEIKSFAGCQEVKSRFEDHSTTHLKRFSAFLNHKKINLSSIVKIALRFFKINLLNLSNIFNPWISYFFCQIAKWNVHAKISSNITNFIRVGFIAQHYMVINMKFAEFLLWRAAINAISRKFLFNNSSNQQSISKLIIIDTLAKKGLKLRKPFLKITRQLQRDPESFKSASNEQNGKNYCSEILIFLNISSWYLADISKYTHLNLQYTNS